MPQFMISNYIKKEKKTSWETCTRMQLMIWVAENISQACCAASLGGALLRAIGSPTLVYLFFYSLQVIGCRPMAQQLWFWLCSLHWLTEENVCLIDCALFTGRPVAMFKSSNNLRDLSLLPFHVPKLTTQFTFSIGRCAFSCSTQWKMLPVFLRVKRYPYISKGNHPFQYFLFWW
jgi:hypothetical protein